MIPLHNFLLYCVLYAVAIAVPGPGVIAIVARALGSAVSAPPFPPAWASRLGDLILMTLSAFGLALVAQAMGQLFLIVKIAGGLYLLYLGYKYWTAQVSETWRDRAAKRRPRLPRLAGADPGQSQGDRLFRGAAADRDRSAAS